MRVGITGATGFIGSALAAASSKRGDTVTLLKRDSGAPIDGLDAIVHLAGESIAGRWTQAKKREIYDSRIAGTRALVDAIERCDNRPKVLVCASAVGYYGDRGDEILDESSAPGTDFLAELCVAWEREAQRATPCNVRVVSIRTSMVLGNGGALKQLSPVFRAYLGGPLGSGRQFMPWIHLDDIVAVYLFALDRVDVGGPLNAVAPDYVTNRRFAHALGTALHRPAVLPTPGFALKVVLGEFASTLLGGQLVHPKKLSELGFRWAHPELDEALQSLAPSS
jgi:uncharacterized protein